jgi:hypothetical protein
MLEWLEGTTFEWDMYVDLPENSVRYCFRTPAVCGRGRLSSDYSEIKIKLKFAPNAAAPNFEPSWNKAPTEPMLVAIRSVDGARVPKMTKWVSFGTGRRTTSCSIRPSTPGLRILGPNPRLAMAGVTEERLLALLKPCADYVLENLASGKAVGKVRNKGPGLVMRADEQARLL